jgi:hypothetical protein
MPFETIYDVFRRIRYELFHAAVCRGGWMLVSADDLRGKPVSRIGRPFFRFFHGFPGFGGGSSSMPPGVFLDEKIENNYSYPQ